MASYTDFNPRVYNNGDTVTIDGYIYEYDGPSNTFSISKSVIDIDQSDQYIIKSTSAAVDAVKIDSVGTGGIEVVIGDSGLNAYDSDGSSLTINGDITSTVTGNFNQIVKIEDGDLKLTDELNNVLKVDNKTVSVLGMPFMPKSGIKNLSHDGFVYIGSNITGTNTPTVYFLNSPVSDATFSAIEILIGVVNIYYTGGTYTNGDLVYLSGTVYNDGFYLVDTDTAGVSFTCQASTALIPNSFIKDETISATIMNFGQRTSVPSITFDVTNDKFVLNKSLQADSLIDATNFNLNLVGLSTGDTVQQALDFIDDKDFNLTIVDTVPPAVTPDFTGQLYIDTTNDNSYISTGTSSSSDFKKINKYEAKYMSGLTLSNSLIDVDYDMVISTGECDDSTGKYLMTLNSNLTKKVDAVWVVGTDQGAFDGNGSTPGGNGLYPLYWYLIKRLDTNVVDVICSLSATSPTLPANYTIYRKIGAWIYYVNAGGGLLDGDMLSDRTVQIDTIFNFGSSSTITTSRTWFASGLPLYCNANIIVRCSASSTAYVMTTTNEQDDTAPTSTLHTNVAGTVPQTSTNKVNIGPTNNNIGARASAASTTVALYIRDYKLID